MKIGSANGGASQDYVAMRGADGAESAQVSKGISKTVDASEVKVESAKKEEDPNQQSAFSEEWMKKSVEQANKSLVPHNRLIERAVHTVTHTVMYTIKDTVTNEVIAEYPPKKIQDMVAKMWELAGLFVDEKA